MRDQALREQAAREAAQEKADSPRGAVASVVKAARSAPAIAPEPIPARVQALWDAARVPPLESWESFSCVAGRCVHNLKADLGQRYTPELVELEKFRVYDSSGRQVAALASLRDFVANLETVLRETRGLVLYGNVGTGKDHLLAAALYYVAHAGIPAAWVSGERLFQAVRDSMDTGQREEKIVQPWLSPAVLGISDPVNPRGDLSDWDARILAGLIDRRYRALRPTWLTMNASNETDAKNRLTPLIWDRLQDGAEVIPCFWQSYRSLRGKPAESIAGKVGTG